MTQTQCQYEYLVTPQKKCLHPAISGDKDHYCLFHSRQDDKNKDNAFWGGIQEKLRDKDFDFEGYYFPPGLTADFSHIEFTDANFSGAIFKDTVSFFDAKFSGKGGAYFGGAEFSGEGGADFRGAKFSGKGGAYFSWAKFSGEGGANFSHAIFSGERGANFSSANFTECNTALFEDTKFETTCKFLHAKFPWSGDRFTIFRGTREPIDLSKCSFLYSNPDRLIFRNFKFIENEPEEFLALNIWRRSFVLSDEKTVDRGETITITREETGESKEPRIKQQEEIKVDYSHVEALYRQFKKNLEEERDWEDAGEFHYGEMECKRKGLTAPEGWHEFIGPLRRNSGLLAWYRYFSGYGERPLRALFWLVFLIFSFAFVYYGLDTSPRQDFWDYYLWNLSIKAAFLQRIGETGNEPVGFFGKLIYLLESALCPTLIAMFILALRRRVKR